jgi:hypothetical protein
LLQCGQLLGELLLLGGHLLNLSLKAIDLRPFGAQNIHRLLHFDVGLLLLCLDLTWRRKKWG